MVGIKGINKQEKKIRNKKDKEWKIIVKARDVHCVICASVERTNCHHIIPKEVKEFRHDPLNGICLCPKHHKFGLESAHKNMLWFFRWLIRNRKEQLKYLINSYDKIR